MPQLPVRDVHGQRAMVERRCRAAALVLGGLGALLVVKRLVFGFMTGQPSVAWNVYTGIGEFHEMSAGVASLATALGLGIASRPIAAWIVRPVPRGCPSCGYDAQPSGDAPCPECGWRPEV